MLAKPGPRSKMYGVYTEGLERARGNPFPNDGDQGLTIEDGVDAKRMSPGLAQQGGQSIVVEGMEYAVADGFVQPSEVVENALRLRAEFVLVCQPEMSSIEGGKVRVGMKDGEDKTTLRVENPDPFAKRGVRRADERQREIADDTMDRSRTEREHLGPLRAHPGAPHRGNRRETSGSSARELTLERACVVPGLSYVIRYAPHSDEERSLFRRLSSLSRPKGVVDQYRSGHVALSDTGVHDDRFRGQRREEGVQVVQELPVFMKIGQVRELL